MDDKNLLTGYNERGDEGCVLVPLAGKIEKALRSLSISEAMPLKPQQRANPPHEQDRDRAKLLYQSGLKSHYSYLNGL